jgi:hypothetical protein
MKLAATVASTFQGKQFVFTLFPGPAIDTELYSSQLFVISP